MDDWDDEYPRARRSEFRHSGVGVASFVIALITGAVIFFCIIIAGVVEASDMGPIHDDHPVAVVIGMTIVICAVGCVAGIALAIAGMMQEKRNKVFAIMGLVFNGLILVGVGLLILVGLFMA